ncbi:MAG TPA: tetratricopeptide repeat protein [Pirellulales bacterium]|jgi:tetratricopeptide (TPR) repeat protein|nr:tetratricopeptide repeat protein [Pirellulales bacterium]
MRCVLCREYLISFVLAAATACSFAGVLSNGFVNFDDDLYVYENRMVQKGLSRPAVNWAFTNTQAANWHPLTWLSLQLDYELFELDPAGYHATSLALHVANTLLIFWLLNRMTGDLWPSACVAGLFALHPLHVESVAWIAERKDVLGTFFLLLSIVCWHAYTRRRAVRPYLLAVGLFVLSLMAKSMGVSLPFLLLLLDVWPLGRWPRQRIDDEVPAAKSSGLPAVLALLAEKLPFFLVAAAFAAVAVLAQGAVGAVEYGQSLPFSQRLLQLPVNYAAYLRLTFWPAGLAMFYPHPGANLPWWKPVAATALLTLITAAALRLKRPAPYLLVGWLWFLVTLLPVIGLVQLGRQAVADRYMYLPMVGLLCVLCFGVKEILGRAPLLTPVVATGTAICLALCAALTVSQVATWHDSVTAWRRVLALTPPDLLSCNNFGLALEQQGRLEEAEQWFRRALEIDPGAFKPNCNLAVVLSSTGRRDEAARHFELALQSNANDPALLESFGILEESRGRLASAIEYYEMAARFDPPSPTALERLLRARRQFSGAPPASSH